MNSNFVPTTMHTNVVLTLFHKCHSRWETVGTTFQLIIWLQSRRQGPFSWWKYRKYLSNGFPNFLDLVPRNREQFNSLKCKSDNFPPMLWYWWKWLELYFNVLLFSNPGENVEINVEILCSPDLRVSPSYVFNQIKLCFFYLTYFWTMSTTIKTIVLTSSVRCSK